MIDETIKVRAAMSEDLYIERRPDGIARIVYDVPGASVNTLRATFAADLEAVVGVLESDATLEAAILVSGKADSWFAGADIEMLRSVDRAEAAENVALAGQKALSAIASCRKPIVAAIHGAALGGGFELALACHGRVLSDDRRTVLGFPEVKLGLLPALTGLERLAERAGLQVALDYGLTGKNLRPSLARKLGVVDEVVPKAILERVASELARQLAGGQAVEAARPKLSLGGRFGALQNDLARLALEKTPVGRSLVFKKARKEAVEKSGGHYPALPSIIDVLSTYAAHGRERSNEVSAHAFGQLAVSRVARHLMQLFLSTRALKKDPGVDSPNVRSARVHDVFVLGAGLMGSGIAHATIEAGMHVRMKDRDDASLSRGLKSIAQLLDEGVARRRMTKGERDQKLGLLTTTLDLSGLGAADLVIEAVFEDLTVKQSVLREIEPHLREDAIFASNTSSIPIGSIAEAAARPERVLGMHYFSPVHKMQLLEVVRGKQTDSRAVATAVEVGKRQGKTVIVVADGPGFYTTRILAPYLNEACWLLMDGLSVEGIERAATEWGWPVGPFALIDEVGIDVAGHVVSVMKRAFGDRFDPPKALDKLLADGRQGRKNGRGFYLYGASAKALGKGKHVDPSVYAALGLAPPASKGLPPNAAEVGMRCALSFVNEAFHALGDRVLRSSRDGDVGAVLGLGFPAFRGGPFQYVEDIGSNEVATHLRRLQDQWGARFTPAPLLLEMAQANRRICA